MKLSCESARADGCARSSARHKRGGLAVVGRGHSHVSQSYDTRCDLPIWTRHRLGTSSGLFRALFVAVAFLFATPAVPSTSDDTLATRDLRVVDSTVEFAHYRFTPAPGSLVEFVDDDAVSLHAVVDGTDVRWMTRGDNGALPSTSKVFQVVLRRSPHIDANADAVPTSDAKGTFALVQKGGVPAIALSGSKDARNGPLAISCTLSVEDMQRLMRNDAEPDHTGVCRFWFYAKPDVLVLVQPYPTDLIHLAPSLLPAFFRLLVSSLQGEN